MCIFLISTSNTYHVGFFLLDHSNQMKLYGEKGLKKSQLLFKSNHSKGLMLLVSCATTLETFSWCTIPLWISLVIWITSGSRKSKNIVLFLILSFFGLNSVLGITPILHVTIVRFLPSARMVGAFHTELLQYMMHFWCNILW